MKLKIKNLALLSLLFGSLFSLKGQMNPCIPPLDPPCNTQCMDITVDNQTTCPLSLYWGYPSCTYTLGFSSAPIPANSSHTSFGQCAKCPDGPCECPSRLFLLNAAGTEFLPWGNFNTMVTTGNSTYIVNPQDNFICPGCGNGSIKITITINSPNSATIKFECI